LFELQPRSKTVFGFTSDTNPSAGTLGHMGVLIHAIRMMHMLDTALNMLGPDTDTLREMLQQLGKRHVGYGVSPHFFPFLGQALTYALAERLGDEWNDDLETAWLDVYEQLSGEIMKSILNGL
jgi:hemoglobin-like flavoprotein